MKNIFAIWAVLLVSSIYIQNSYAGVKKKTNKAPNIIVVLIDDMGWKDFSCFGNVDASTPNIDGLANAGIRFNHFYVNAPICSPSRVALSTGQYPQRHKVTSYLAKRDQNETRGMVNWLDPSAPTIARYLKSGGYATGHFGKWHMGGQRDVTDAPAIAEYGFDQSVTNFEGMGPKLLPIVRFPNPDELGDTIETHIWDEKDLGGPITYMMRSKITGGYIDNAINFIDEAQSNNKPFFINVWPDDVHTPMYPSIDRWSDNKKERYRAVLEEMDEQFAVLFNRIQNDPRLKDNTIILICSDNGPENGCGSAGVFKGYKGSLYEGGIRSPLIVWGPGFTNPDMHGEINNTSVLAAVDVLPSVLSWSEISLPEDIDFDGHDMSSTFTGNSLDSRPKPIFFRRPPDRANTPLFGNMPDLAMRSGKWKFLCDLGGTNPQLYNLENDPGETNNVFESNKLLAEQMKQSLLAWNGTMPRDAGVPDDTYLVNNLDKEDVVFYYPFDENIDDYSSNNVILNQDVGRSPVYEAGYKNQSIAMNQMRFVTNITSHFDPYESHTLAAWIKLKSLPSDNGVNQVFVHQLDDPLNDVGRVHLETLKEGNIISSFTGGNSNGNHRTSGGRAIEIGTWYHIAMVWDRKGKTKFLYVNGELENSITITSSERCNGQYVIGANKVKDFFMDGNIDELILVKQALSPMVIYDLYTNQKLYTNIRIEKKNIESSFTIHPNPNTGQFRLNYDFDGTANYQVFDINGRQVQRGTLQKDSVISLPDIEGGTYLVTLDVDESAYTKKMIVK